MGNAGTISCCPRMESYFVLQSLKLGNRSVNLEWLTRSSKGYSWGLYYQDFFNNWDKSALWNEQSCEDCGEPSGASSYLIWPSYKEWANRPLTSFSPPHILSCGNCPSQSWETSGTQHWMSLLSRTFVTFGNASNSSGPWGKAAWDLNRRGTSQLLFPQAIFLGSAHKVPILNRGLQPVVCSSPSDEVVFQKEHTTLLPANLAAFC